uniref:Ionotropic glutamate receptor C-terminal domain-containing protein n=2 Tax=Musca domestica TaxID=7370 RepID=A0A1I8M877_MUSDO
MLAAEASHWSTVINIILQLYFSDLTTTCVLWNKDFDLHGTSFVNFNVVLIINPWNLNDTFSKDIYNFEKQDNQLSNDGIDFDDWIKKFVAAISHTHCEGFVVFQDDIPRFAHTYRKASVYSLWRSFEPKFLFAYTKEKLTEDYFQDLLFKNIANILVIETDFKNATQFYIKTNKFVGSLFENPNELIDVSVFNAIEGTFEPTVDLYPRNKLQNLQGREIIVGAFDYRPFVVVDFNRLPLYYDHAEDNPRHLVHIDGTEMRIVHTFCELYNCSVQVDTTEKEEWGTPYPNYTSDGMIGTIIDGKTHMGMGAMYAWYMAYKSIDQTTFLGRSGVTCLVPAPSRKTRWTLPIRPFPYSLWLAVIFCLCWETVALCLTRFFEDRVVVRQNNASIWSSIQFAYVTTLKLFISQSSRYVVRSHTVRTILFACYMIDIIVSSIYAGGLSAILTIPDLTEAPDSVARLYSHNLTWTSTSYAWITSIVDEGDGPKDPIFHRILANYRINSMDEMRSKAKTENMGFALERMAFGHFGNGDFFTPEALQHLKLMVEDIYYSFTVAMVPRMWPHLPKYNDLILAWHSSGLSKYWEWKIVAEYMNANEQNRVQASMYNHIDVGPVQLDVDNFAGFIGLWIAGIFMSILVFIGEWICYWWNRNQI